ncbi:uncharacterized protein LOC112457681 [Temnothorax curvispinosus]|uniref:Uncharacterized protein LOC112457681 n=1 Tax=Temnothorax curvispinosus TaxID=300111 RepID=A0A6J1Q383_9HYME|nr:uncharacterized protein LOC112457681 [Temnothorax curvispinosus]
MRPRIVDPETSYLVSDNGECEKMAEDINECINKVNEHCGNSTKQKKISVLDKSRCKKKLKTGEVDNIIWTSESIAHLIQLVKNNDIIWNYCIPMKERSKFKISIAWDFIVEDLKDTFPDISSFFNPIVVQSKWKSLVDYFWRKVASRPKTTGSAAAAPESWPYFENMTFL